MARRLRHWGGASLRGERLPVSALVRVPDDVREQALDSCLFVTIDRATGGFYIPSAAAQADGFIVVLNEDWSDEDFESGVAHELAHLALGHPAADLVLDVAAHEDDVAAKVRNWGFTEFGSLAFADRRE